MKKIYDGKTKQVFERDDGLLVLFFKDDVTGTGEEIDPGGNEVVGTLEGKGLSSLKLTNYFFKLLKENNIPTHFVSADLEEKTMVVKKAHTYGLEIICRQFAYGSFVRRYPEFATKMQPLNFLVEVTVKNDETGDPLINDEALLTLEILDSEELKQITIATKKAANLIAKNLKEKGLELIDLKFEFGKTDDNVVIIDEISGDSMRVSQNNKILSQTELSQKLIK